MSREVKATIVAIVLPLVAGGTLYSYFAFPIFVRAVKTGAAFGLIGILLALWWSICYDLVGGKR